MPYSVNRERKSFFSRYSNEFRIEFEPMTWVLLDFRRMEMFSLQSHQIKKTGWWEGNCLIYEYIFWASDCDYQNQKKSFMRNVGPHTRTGEYPFVPVFPKLIHFFVISVAVVDCGWFNSSSSSIFGILMVHFSRNAYFSMQSHSLVREPFSDLHWRNKREKKPAATRNEIEKVQKSNNDKNSEKNTTTTTAAEAKRNICTHYTAAMRSTEHIIHHSNRRTILLSIL